MSYRLGLAALVPRLRHGLRRVVCEGTLQRRKLQGQIPILLLSFHGSTLPVRAPDPGLSIPDLHQLLLQDAEIDQISSFFMCATIMMEPAHPSAQQDWLGPAQKVL
jgi:hypothetical protein